MNESDSDESVVYVDLTAPPENHIFVVDLTENEDEPRTTEMTADGRVVNTYNGVERLQNVVNILRARRRRRFEEQNRRRRSEFVRQNVFRDVSGEISNATNLDISRMRPLPAPRRRSGEADKENIRPSGSGLANTAYCVKCKEKRQMVDANEVTTKNNRKALQGKCKVCGTKMMRFTK